MALVYDNFSAIFSIGKNYEMAISNPSSDTNLPLWVGLGYDFQRFKEYTADKNVVMGRKTWDLLDDSVKPISGRSNYVISSGGTSFFGAEKLGSMEAVLELIRTNPSQEYFAIGGPTFLKAALPHVKNLYLTIVHCSSPDATCHLDRESWDDIMKNFKPESSGFSHFLKGDSSHLFCDVVRKD